MLHHAWFYEISDRRRPCEIRIGFVSVYFVSHTLRFCIDMEPSQSIQERERLQQEILQIRQALQATDDVESDDEVEENDVAGEVTGSDREDEAGPSGQGSTVRSTPASINLDSCSFQPLQEAHSDSAFSVHQDQDVSFDHLQLDESGNLPTSLEAALAINRAYQEIVFENIKQLEEALIENREKQKMIEAEIDGKVGTKVKKSKAICKSDYAIPYFKDEDGLPAPVNEDTKIKRAGEPMDHHLTKPPKTWTAEEKKKLQKAVKEDNLKQLLQPHMNRKELELEKLAEAKSINEEKEIQSRIKDIDQKISDIQKTSDKKIFESLENCETIDWMKIANIHFEGNRTASDCLNAWKNVLHPDINKKKWTADEDKKLKEIVESFEERNWGHIAEALGTGRSSFMCLQRYQQKLNPLMRGGPFTPEEDELLREVVAYSQVGNMVHWVQVVYYMEGRSVYQCKKRWEQLEGGYNMGRWSTDEDYALKSAIDKYGEGDFVKIARMVPGRSAPQCRERWRNVLSSDLRFDPWTYEEDRKLLELVGKYGRGKWSQIAAGIPGRHDRMVRDRYLGLMKLKQQMAHAKQQGGQSWALEGEELQKKLQEQLFDIQERYDRDKEKMKEMMQANMIQELATAPNKSLTLITAENRSKEFELDNKRGTELQLLYTKLLKEKEEEERQINMQLKDMENGLFIPRPLNRQHFKQDRVQRWDMLLDAMDGYLQKKMSKLIKEKVEPDKMDKEFGSTTAAAVARLRRLKSSKALTPELRFRIHLLSPETTVKEVLSVSQEIKKQLTGLSKRGKKHTKLESRRLDNLLDMALRRRVTFRVKPGRPRKYLKQTKLQYLSAGNMDEDERTDLILPLLFKTEAIDVLGAEHNLKVQQQLKEQKEAEEEREKKAAEARNNAERTTASGRPLRKRKAEMEAVCQEPDLKAVNLEQDMQTLVRVLEAQPQLRQFLQTVKSNKSPRSSAEQSKNPEQEQGQGIMEQSSEKDGVNPDEEKEKSSDSSVDALPAEKETPTVTLQSREKTSHSSVKTPAPDQNTPMIIQSSDMEENLEGQMTNENTQNPRTKELHIQEAPGTVYKNYDLPPFPPTCSTINGFKSVLLDRRKLMSVGGQYCNNSPMVRVHLSECQATEKGNDRNSSDTTVTEGKKKRKKKSSSVTPKAKKSKKDSGTNNLNFVVYEENPLTSIRETHDYKMLKARFISLFLWPALLSTIRTPELLPNEGNEWNADFVESKKTDSNKRKTKKKYACTKGIRFRKGLVKLKEEKEKMRIKTEAAMKQRSETQRKLKQFLSNRNNCSEISATSCEQQQPNGTNQSDVQEGPSQLVVLEDPNQTRTLEQNNQSNAQSHISQGESLEYSVQTLPVESSGQGKNDGEHGPSEAGTSVSVDGGMAITNEDAQKAVSVKKRPGRPRGPWIKRVWFKPGEKNTRTNSRRTSKEVALESFKDMEIDITLPKRQSQSRISSSGARVDSFVKAVERLREEKAREEALIENSYQQPEILESSGQSNVGQGDCTGGQGQIILVPSTKEILTPVVLREGEALVLGQSAINAIIEGQREKDTENNTQE
ncbi:uncharacterized protein LOC106177515 [Lingula anatina]|uniref:Uncharacterized protein LOC106177515 n=1 Tax=Lingula anatina TaxID=7574 RepID=A0A1S3JZD2_LINAN|nr:uncharacterized protein LOC106177515 [Lingula anatina]|eukprot:XP_013415763.1 uncharacterized protein LOC106177515 [Lingula anatina]